MQHAGISCKVCSANPITGIRYKCFICENFDVCNECEKQGKHIGHPLIKLRSDEYKLFDQQNGAYKI